MDARLCLQSGMHRNHPSSLWSSGHPQRAQKVNHALLQSNRERYGSRIVVVRAKIEACKCVYRKRRKDGWREYFYFLYGVHDSMSTSVDLRGRTSTGGGLIGWHQCYCCVTKDREKSTQLSDKHITPNRKLLQPNNHMTLLHRMMLTESRSSPSYGAHGVSVSS